MEAAFLDLAPNPLLAEAKYCNSAIQGPVAVLRAWANEAAETPRVALKQSDRRGTSRRSGRLQGASQAQGHLPCTSLTRCRDSPRSSHFRTTRWRDRLSGYVKNRYAAGIVIRAGKYKLTK